MLVYREQRREEQTAQLLGALRTELAGLTSSSADVHDRSVRVLIDLGVLEAALADAVHPETDGLHPLTDALRRASIAAGHLLWHSWHGGREWLGSAMVYEFESRAALDDFFRDEPYCTNGIYQKIDIYDWRRGETA